MHKVASNAHGARGSVIPEKGKACEIPYVGTGN